MDLVERPALVAAGAPLLLERARGVRERGLRRLLLPPRVPTGEVELGDRVEPWAERADQLVLEASRRRLVRRERRDRDVVVGARRLLGEQLLPEPHPVARHVEENV